LSSVRVKSALRCRRVESAVTERADWTRSGSSGELGAALATAAGNDRAAGTGPHAQTEAVHTSTTTVVGLESTLPLSHGNSSILRTTVVWQARTVPAERIHSGP
jgi:hypothetical protein